MNEIIRELALARAKFNDYHSTHEALGVITEEYFELMDAVRANDIEGCRKEALQIAACCLRMVEDVCDKPNPLSLRGE